MSTAKRPCTARSARSDGNDASIGVAFARDQKPRVAPLSAVAEPAAGPSTAGVNRSRCRASGLVEWPARAPRLSRLCRRSTSLAAALRATGAAEQLQSATLHIRVSSSAVASELSYVKDVLLEQVNTQLGQLAKRDRAAPSRRRGSKPTPNTPAVNTTGTATAAKGSTPPIERLAFASDRSGAAGLCRLAELHPAPAPAAPRRAQPGIWASPARSRT